MSSPTQDNLDAIEDMNDAGASSMTSADQAELVEQAGLSVARGPKRIRSANNEEIDAHPLPDLIAYENHLAAKGASEKAHFGFRFSQLIPPGCG